MQPSHVLAQLSNSSDDADRAVGDEHAGSGGHQPVLLLNENAAEAVDVQVVPPGVEVDEADYDSDGSGSGGEPTGPGLLTHAMPFVPASAAAAVWPEELFNVDGSPKARFVEIFTEVFHQFCEHLVVRRNRERRMRLLLGFHPSNANALVRTSRSSHFDKNVLRLVWEVLDEPYGLSVKDMQFYIYTCIGLDHGFALPSMSTTRMLGILDRHAPECRHLPVEERYLSLDGFLEFYVEAASKRPESVRKDIAKLGYDLVDLSKPQQHEIEFDPHWAEKRERRRLTNREQYQPQVAQLVDMGFPQPEELLYELCASSYGNLQTVLSILDDPKFYLKPLE